MTMRKRGNWTPPKNAGKKSGRNRYKCERYRAEGRREKNKRRRIEKDARRGRKAPSAHLSTEAAIVPRPVGALAQLGAQQRGTLKVMGSSPIGSTSGK